MHYLTSRKESEDIYDFAIQEMNKDSKNNERILTYVIPITCMLILRSILLFRQNGNERYKV